MTVHRTFNAAYLALLKGRDDRVAEPSSAPYRSEPTEKITEHIIQLLWRNGLFHKNDMKTTTGLPVEIITPGRLNRSSGPDFKNAEIAIDGARIVGDVEIHIHPEGWYQHNHHLSPLYNRTVLHVFLQRRQNITPAFNLKGKMMHEIELAPYLRHTIGGLKEELEEADLPITGRAGTPPCRELLLSAGIRHIHTLLDLVAEGRMLIKADRLARRLHRCTSEQLLHETLFECLGYSRFRSHFRKIARTVTREKLQEGFGENPRHARHLTAQAVLFKAAGLMERPNACGNDEELAELLTLLHSVTLDAVDELFDPAEWRTGRYRPLNSPHRRIAAFSHLIDDALMEACRNDIECLNAGYGAPENKKKVARLLERFTSASDPFWNRRYTFTQKARIMKKLVGRDRAISIAVDCLIPYHLVQSHRKGDTLLEHKLLTLFHLLPKPSSNAIIDFMLRNLFGKGNTRLVRTVRHQQALLQLYNDFCHLAPAGCANCAFLEYVTITDPHAAKGSA